jgi:hypothetical protein
LFTSVLLLVTGVGIGVGLWLWLNADDTLHQRTAAQPVLTVAVAGGAQPEKPPTAPAATTPTTPTGASGTPGAAPPDKAGAAAVAPATGNSPGPDDAFALAKAPAPEMTEDSRNGMLPVIAADGRQSWQVYARPYPAAEKRGRIAIVIGQLGANGAATGLALQQLPPGITFGFLPIAERLEGWVDASRSQGHEVILLVPMEPLNYPHDDPGPNTLLLGLDTAHNLDRLEWALGRFTGYVGITSPSGSRFGTESAAMRPIMEVMKKRGLLFLDAGTAPGLVGTALAIELSVPHARVDRIIDHDPSRASIDDELHALETIALKDGAAIGMGEPYPTTLERIARWAPLLADKKLVLTPLSAVANLQKPPAADTTHSEQH